MLLSAWELIFLSLLSPPHVPLFFPLSSLFPLSQVPTAGSGNKGQQNSQLACLGQVTVSLRREGN